MDPQGAALTRKDIDDALERLKGKDSRVPFPVLYPVGSDAIDVPFAHTPYGFKYGAAEVMRIGSDKKRGWVVLQVRSEKGTVQVYVTKTGKIRVHWDGEEMHKS